jgi:hypothetical protein
MRKLVTTVIVLGLLGAGGYLLYRHVLAPPEQRACRHLADLCGNSDEAGQEALQRCQGLLQDLTRASGGKRMKKVTGCILESQSCAKGMGCLAGAGLGAAGEFFDGLREAIGGE